MAIGVIAATSVVLSGCVNKDDMAQKAAQQADVVMESAASAAKDAANAAMDKTAGAMKDAAGNAMNAAMDKTTDAMKDAAGGAMNAAQGAMDAATDAMTAKKVYTMAEVAKHNTRQDCWTVVDGMVADVTKFFGMHPGGDDKLAQACGKDATALFKSIKDHDPKGYEKFKSFIIGSTAE